MICIHSDLLPGMVFLFFSVLFVCIQNGVVANPHKTERAKITAIVGVKTYSKSLIELKSMNYPQLEVHTLLTLLACNLM